MVRVKQLLFIALIALPPFAHADDASDLSSFGEAAAPTTPSDSTSTPIGTSPAEATPAAPAAADSATKSEQLKWPDAIELEENREVGGMGNTDIKTIFASGQTAVANMNKSINTITKTREELYQKYFSLTDNVDDVLQATQVSLGTLNQIFNPTDKNH